jgi:hypothetical protein
MIEKIKELYEKKQKADRELREELNRVARKFEKMSPEEFEQFINIICLSETMIASNVKEIYKKLSQLAKGDFRYCYRKAIFHKIHKQFL